MSAALDETRSGLGGEQERITWCTQAYYLHHCSPKDARRCFFQLGSFVFALKNVLGSHAISSQDMDCHDIGIQDMGRQDFPCFDCLLLLVASPVFYRHRTFFLLLELFIFPSGNINFSFAVLLPTVVIRP